MEGVTRGPESVQIAANRGARGRVVARLRDGDGRGDLGLHGVLRVGDGRCSSPVDSSRTSARCHVEGREPAAAPSASAAAGSNGSAWRWITFHAPSSRRRIVVTRSA